MRVVELEFRPGGFAFELSASVEPSKRRRLVDAVRDGDGFVAVFDTRVQVPSLSAARWTGRVVDREGRNGFSGFGLAGLLQSDENNGLHITVPRVRSSRSLASWMTEFFPFGGLTVGTVTTTGLSNLAATWPVGLGAREMLDLVCAGVGGAKWRVRPDGKVDAGLPQYLFETDPKVIVSEQPGSELGDVLRGVDGVVSNLVERGRERTSRTVGFGAGEGGDMLVASSAPVTVAYGLDGVAVTISRTLDMVTAEDASALSQFVSASAARFAVLRRAFGVSVFSPGARRWVQPGDAIWVWSPQDDVVDASQGVSFLGQRISPVKAWVHQIEWQSHPGQGVWLKTRDGWTDLSESVLFGDGSAELTVSDDADAFRPVTDAGPDRLGAGASTSGVQLGSGSSLPEVRVLGGIKHGPGQVPTGSGLVMA